MKNISANVHKLCYRNTSNIPTWDTQKPHVLIACKRRTCPGASRHSYSPPPSVEDCSCSPLTQCLAQGLSISHDGSPAFLSHLRSLKRAVLQPQTRTTVHGWQPEEQWWQACGIEGLFFFLYQRLMLVHFWLFRTKLMSLHSVSRVSCICCTLHFLWISYTAITRL